MLAATFSRPQAAHALGIPSTALDALINAGTLPVREGAISASDLEALLRETLLRLYRAEVRFEEVELEMPEAAEETAAAAPVEAAPADATADIVPYFQSLTDFQPPVASEDRPDLRLAPRYIPRRQLGGMFRQVKFSVLQMSATGLRIRHDDSLRPGDEARLTFSIVRAARSFAMKARVVWTSIAQKGDQPSFCISGLRITDGDEQMRQALTLLLSGRDIEVEGTITKRVSPPALTGLADDDVAAIIRGFRLLGSDPVEANKWYTRARFALADEAVRKAAPVRGRDRDEVVALWELLGRRMEIKTVAGVVAWIRQTRSASASTT
jgi:Tfp pilus assembly protein PilZ